MLSLLLIVAGILCLIFVAWPLGLILGIILILIGLAWFVPAGGYSRRGWY